LITQISPETGGFENADRQTVYIIDEFRKINDADHHFYKLISLRYYEGHIILLKTGKIYFRIDAGI